MRGFSLIGVLVSLLIATIGLLGLLRMSAQLGSTQQDTLLVHRVNVLAQNVFEQSLASDTYHASLPTVTTPAPPPRPHDVISGYWPDDACYWVIKDDSGTIEQVWFQWTSGMNDGGESRMCFSFNTTTIDCTSTF